MITATTTILLLVVYHYFPPAETRKEQVQKDLKELSSRVVVLSSIFLKITWDRIIIIICYCTFFYDYCERYDSALQ